MGTNYFARFNECPTCKRHEEIHIGKSSAGWTFSFHATDKIRSWKDWEGFLTSEVGCRIFNEYGEEKKFSEFKELIENKKDAPNNHSKIYSDNCFLDSEGNSMCEGEFS